MSGYFFKYSPVRNFDISLFGMGSLDLSNLFGF